MIVRDYYVEVETIASEDGGGLFATVPDLPGCMSDGDSLDDLSANVGDAIECWIAAAKRLGRDVPAPAVVRERRA